jgi:hypothetical protein
MTLPGAWTHCLARRLDPRPLPLLGPMTLPGAWTHVTLPAARTHVTLPTARTHDLAHCSDSREVSPLLGPTTSLAARTHDLARRLDP